MDSFSYLSVLISIILGLGVAHLLGGFAELIKQRDALKLWWPTPLWMTTTFLILVQTWWALFTLHSVTQWKLPEVPNLIAHGLFILFAITALLARSRRLQTSLAVVGLVLLCGYIALLFTALPQ